MRKISFGVLVLILLCGCSVYRLSLIHILFLDLANEDTGSHMALGILLEKKLSGKPIQLYPVYSDSRIGRNQASGLDLSLIHIYLHLCNA